MATTMGVRYVTVPIEQLMARGQHDPAGPLVRRRIGRTYERTAYHLRVVSIRDGEGREQTVRVTDEHPFFVASRGWTKAKDLSAGDQLLGVAGEASTVISNLGEAHPEGVTVYNLEVEDDHTYFVRAEGSDGEPVWVHNATYDDNVMQIGQSADGLELHSMARRYRRYDRTISRDQNVAIAKVRVDGIAGHLTEVNTPKAMHSEGYIIQRVQQLRAQGRSVEVLSIYTERFPCGNAGLEMNCLGNIRKEFGTIPIYYATSEKGPISW